MALLVSDILRDVRAITTDPLGVRWLDAELIEWVNHGLRQCVLIKPDSNPITEEFVCAAGFKQDFLSLSSTLAALLEVVSNTTTGGGTTAPVTFTKRNELDIEFPTWREVAQAADAEHYMYDTRQRDYFYLYPPVVAGATIELVYAGIPVAVTAIGDAIPLQDIYGPALTNYVAWRCFSKDSDFSGDMNLAGGYYGAFLQALTGKTQAEQTESPDRKPPPAVVEAIG